MRKEHGLSELIKQHKGCVNKRILSQLLLADLKNCQCSIYGEIAENFPLLLAELTLIPESLYFEQFDQRIDFIVAGEIINNQSPPLTYKVQGDKYSFDGRCSVIPQVCGVDLYLGSKYTEKVGERIQQRFSIAVMLP